MVSSLESLRGSSRHGIGFSSSAEPHLASVTTSSTSYRALCRRDINMGHNHNTNNVDIIDIGGGRLKDSLRNMLIARMLDPTKQCVLPSALLSDDHGAMLWTKINRLPDYYQTRDEIALLEVHGKEIADVIPPDCLLIDIGCGDTRKVLPLLVHLDRIKKPVHYYGLDLSLPALQSTLSQLATHNFSHITLHGLWGTFDDAIHFVPTLSPPSTSSYPSPPSSPSCSPGSAPAPAQPPRWFLSLGSILGNDFPEPATKILSRWTALLRPDPTPTPANGPTTTTGDRILLGMDSTTSPTLLWASYHDPQNLFEQFMRNGLQHSNRVLGVNWYRPEDWDVVGVMSTKYVMHQFMFRAKRDVRCEAPGPGPGPGGVVKIEFPKGHEIDCYEAFKFGPEEMGEQFRGAGVREVGRWKAPGSSGIYEYLLCRDTTSQQVNGES
ncbi:hypothetical protein VTJ49DRAFT_5911 [Mycothermus thermophilus]|uniref:Histidine-specific methyltransferase SAM-dependent domain-containing protein n=1 Tax=Humicola insolens TaxID=85995 RepID=A0ABR3V289_HUMIN